METWLPDVATTVPANRPSPSTSRMAVSRGEKGCAHETAAPPMEILISVHGASSPFSVQKMWPASATALRLSRRRSGPGYGGTDGSAIALHSDTVSSPRLMRGGQLAVKTSSPIVRTCSRQIDRNAHSGARCHDANAIMSPHSRSAPLALCPDGFAGGLLAVLLRMGAEVVPRRLRKIDVIMFCGLLDVG